MRNLICATLLICLTGCASFERHENSTKLVVQYSTLKYLERIPEQDRAARAERIRKIAGDVKALATGSTSLVLLREVVDAELVKAELSPADRLLANGLVDTIIAELQARIGSGMLSPDQLVQVAQVIGWIEEATRLA